MTISSFVRPHIERLALDYEVHVICDIQGSSELNELASSTVRIFDVAIPRNPHVFRDSVALINLIRMFVRTRPMAVQTVTPKAGLIGMFAAWLTRVPVRIHWFTGQVWADSIGLQKYVLKAIDKFITKLATDILVDGRSQLHFMIEQGILQSGKGVVLNEGSIRGVDAQRFQPSREARNHVRVDLGLADEEFVVCFAGRLRERKGFTDLLEAMSLLPGTIPATLLAVGHDEESLRFIAQEKLKQKFVYVPHTERMEDYLASADVLVLPSYREGFGQSALEASACGLPVVVSDIYGLEDAVVPGVTGLTIELGDPASIADAIEVLYLDPAKRHALGSAGRQRAMELFDQECLIQAYVKYVRDLMRARNLEVDC